MPMQIPEELFHHELSAMYAFEQHNVETLQRLAREAQHATARRPIEHHLRETREQVKLLEECFEALGQKPKKMAIHVAKGLQQDHDAVIKMQPGPDLMTVHAVASAAKIEHMEVAAYRALIDQATLLKQREVVRRLREILKQEQAAVRELEAAGKAVTKETVEAALAKRNAEPETAKGRTGRQPKKAA